MRHCEAVAEANPPSPPSRVGIDDPVSVLRRAFARLWTVPVPVKGSATACIAQLDRNTGELSVANLGDSGLIVLRNGSVILATEPQHHAFNFPFQIAVMHNGDHGEDGADHADTYTTRVEPGDLIILMTDGVLDNIPVQAIVDELRGLPDADPETISTMIVDAARERSMRKDFDSPFSIAARCAGLDFPRQGKEDDITVVVGRVEA